MIKTPVSVGSIGTSNYHTSSCYPLLIDANFKPLNNECAKEAAKRINMHDELVENLKISVGYIKEIYSLNGIEQQKSAINRFESLLERCK